MIAKQTMKSVMVAVAAIVLTVVFHSTAYAGSTSVSLVRSELTNVDDAAGRWQHEAGNIVKNNVVVGQYAITRRVTFGGYPIGFRTVSLSAIVNTPSLEP